MTTHESYIQSDQPAAPNAFSPPATQPPRYRWWHAVLFYSFANAGSFIGARSRNMDIQYYENLRQAPFAPPGWLFAPAWFVNNVLVLWGNLRLLNQDKHTPHRRTLLWLQGVSWLLYSTFGYVYFTKRSLILAFAWTATMYVLTIISIVLSLRVDRSIARSFITLFLWLSLATPVAMYQMLHNPDVLFGTPARRR